MSAIDWDAPTCCVCAGQDRVLWCWLCKHWFCEACRWSPVERVKGAVREVGGVPPSYCRHEKGRPDRAENDWAPEEKEEK